MKEFNFKESINELGKQAEKSIKEKHPVIIEECPDGIMIGFKLNQDSVVPISTELNMYFLQIIKKMERRWASELEKVIENEINENSIKKVMAGVIGFPVLNKFGAIMSGLGLLLMCNSKKHLREVSNMIKSYIDAKVMPDLEKEMKQRSKNL